MACRMGSNKTPRGSKTKKRVMIERGEEIGEKSHL